MARLVDRFRTIPVGRSAISMLPADEHTKLVADMREDLGSAPAIVIDNVADYVFGVGARDRWDISDIPNGAPPWPLAWYEYRVPAAGRMEGSPTELGYWVAAEAREGGGWTLHMTVWGLVAGKPDVVGPMGAYQVDVAQDGAVELFTPMTLKGWTNETAYASILYLIPVLLANAFAHCRNVHERIVTPPTRLSKAFRRRHGADLSRYRVLVIDPMREVLRTEGRSETVGSVRALHICRGHFKTYDRKPLFSRIRGTYWWPAHVRGKLDAGEVVKDYVVRSTGPAGGLEAEATPAGEGAPAEGARYASPALLRDVEDFSVAKAMDYLRTAYPGLDIHAMSHDNPGYDIRVGPATEPVRYVEVKGTTTERPAFFITENERQFSLTHADRYTLILLADIDLGAGSASTHLHDGPIDDRFSLSPMQWRATFPGHQEPPPNRPT